MLIDTVAWAEGVASQGATTWPADILPFDWIPTVWAFGFHRLHARTADVGWQDYYRRWIDTSLPEFSPDDFTSSDSVSPALLAAALAEEDPEVDYAVIIDGAEAYLRDVPRTRDGAIPHWGPDNTWGFPSDQVWVDSQFMFGMTMLQRYVTTGDAGWRDDFVEQYRLFSVLCRDGETQLYRHAWDDASAANIPEEPVFWARGNAWVLVSGAEALHALDADDPGRAEVARLFEAHADAVLAHQDTDGLWRTVLNSPYGADPLNYTETSASALIAYAWARALRAEALDPDRYGPSLRAALAGLEARISVDDDGVITLAGTSMGTNPGDYDMYVNVPQVDDLMLGYGAVIMAFAEAHNLLVP